MKTKIFIMHVLLILFLLPFSSDAAIIFDTTDWIIDKEGLTYEFIADEEPTTYQAELSDLSISPNFGFDLLFLSITTSTETLGSIDAPGILYFDVELGKTYFANVFGIGSGISSAGNFGVKIESVPIPSAVWLLGSGLIGFVGFRNKFRRS
jgi:hypothetical protein